ncbi:MAG TPA: enoyl-CoA hydratase/isomerase family protein [Gemmatimonadales bacterium]|nr:enoyl-CoA hydratase/isomerase family protein [Gemmatimonadales bacterium]
MLTTHLDAGVLTLTLDRPDKRNALSSALIEALHQGLERAELDGEVRVVVIKGAGKDFCAGADLDELLASADRDPAENEASALRLGALFQAIRRLPKPVVAVVQGRALAGGCGLATACDFVLAADTAQFGYPEIQRGFVPAMVMAMLVRQVGEKRALDLTGTGRLLTAAEAYQMGLVTSVIGAPDFGPRALDLIRQLTTVSATAYALTKQLCYAQDGIPFDDAIALGARINAMSRATPDFKSAIAAFLKK